MLVLVSLLYYIILYYIILYYIILYYIIVKTDLSVQMLYYMLSVSLTTTYCDRSLSNIQRMVRVREQVSNVLSLSMP